MNYVFQFGLVWEHWPRLLQGASQTVQLSLAAFAIGLVLAIACAAAQMAAPRWVRGLVTAYVELIRNTPLLMQLFVLYFSLPALGIRLAANEAALAGMAINFGGYGTEIIRAGVEAIPRGQIEAGRALGLSTLRIFQKVVLFQAIGIAWPALSSQFVLLLLGSSIVSAISAEELTAITNTLQSTTFRAFEFYFVATAMYLAMALACRGLLDGLFWLIFVQGRPAR